MNFKIISTNLKLICVVSLLINGAAFGVFGQSIGKPTFQYTGMCGKPNTLPPPADDSFLKFSVDFSIGSISSFGGGNVFHLQISDVNGSFVTATDVASSSTISSSPASIIFVIPSNFVGSENYKFRIRSTNPVRLSPESDAIYAYYKPFNENFSLNNGSTVALICGTGTVELKVDSPASTFSNLVYRWYKDGLLISGQTSNTYQASLPGAYYAELNYGSCTTSGFTFNSKPDIIVNISTSGQNPQISKSPDLDIVSLDNPITLSTNIVTGFSYQWSLNDVDILGAVGNSFTATIPGSYKVTITNGTCIYSSNKSILIKPKDVEQPTTNVVPNLISPNNDGENDKWVISDFTGNLKTAVEIIDSNGKKVFESKSYQDTWPEEQIDFDSISPVYYYIITLTTGEVKKGTITIVK